MFVEVFLMFMFENFLAIAYFCVGLQPVNRILYLIEKLLAGGLFNSG